MMEPGEWFTRREIIERAYRHRVLPDTTKKDFVRFWRWGWLERKPTGELWLPHSWKSRYRYPAARWRYRLTAIGKEERAAVVEAAARGMFS